jgi:hypothetical protein
LTHISGVTLEPARLHNGADNRGVNRIAALHQYLGALFYGNRFYC